jgi:deoxyribodipyrimidine photolyase-like uncharacterized protein
MKTLINIKSIAVFAVLLAILISCNNQEKETEKTATNDKIQKVEVVKPEQRSFLAEVSITGTTRPNQIVTLYAMEGGMLMQMRKDIGDKVKQGETIAVLENPELQRKPPSNPILFWFPVINSFAKKSTYAKQRRNTQAKIFNDRSVAAKWSFTKSMVRPAKHFLPHFSLLVQAISCRPIASPK